MNTPLLIFVTLAWVWVTTVTILKFDVGMSLVYGGIVMTNGGFLYNALH